MALNDVKKISGRLIYLEGNVPAQAAYIESVEAETLPPGSEAYARNDGSSQNVDLVFGIPQGEQGEQGERGYTGNGIASITLIQTVGLVKVYRILFTDGEYFDFPVADGNGISGITKVSTDVLEDTYRISYTDGTTSTYKVKNGRGIVSVTKTGTSGLVDTYTISYNDGTSSTFTVTNGEKGDTGNGIVSITKTGTSGLVDTYTIAYTNGTSTTFTVTNGEKGDTGNGIASIEKTATVGLVDTYTITMTDGTTTTFDVTNGSDEWGAITGTLSDQTDLKTALDSKAPAITETASGSIASFSDGSPAPVTALTVAIEPVQDLHGYDNPWPAGGGKNLCPLESMTTTSGGNLNSGQGLLGKVESGETYTLSFYCNTASTANITVRIVDSGGTQTAQTSGNLNPSNRKTYTFTASVSGDVCVNANLGSTYANVKAISDIQLESGSSATSFVPYSNICPISGHTSATVTRTGKNLLDKSQEVKNWFISSDKVTNSANGKSVICPCKSNKTYTVSKLAGQRFAVGYTKTVPAVGVDVYGTITNNSGNSITITTGDNAVYLFIYFYNGSYDTVTEAEMLNSLQIELGSTASAYEPYQGTSVTISLGEERYGGTLDVTTGKLVVDRAFIEDASKSYWELSNYTHVFRLTMSPEAAYDYEGITSWFSESSNSVSGVGNLYWTKRGGNHRSIYIRDDRYTTVADFKASISGLQFCYELSSSFTVQLTSAQMQTLLGENHIWADTGDTLVTYRADTKLYIEEQIAESETLTRKMIADSATADGKAPKSLATGDLIIVGDELRKATANIGQGSAITASNSTTATLADVIKALQ